MDTEPRLIKWPSSIIAPTFLATVSIGRAKPTPEKVPNCKETLVSGCELLWIIYRWIWQGFCIHMFGFGRDVVYICLYMFYITAYTYIYHMYV